MTQNAIIKALVAQYAAAIMQAIEDHNLAAPEAKGLPKKRAKKVRAKKARAKKVRK